MDILVVDVNDNVPAKWLKTRGAAVSPRLTPAFSRPGWPSTPAKAEGPVGGEGFAIDASVIKADAKRQRGVPGSEASWDRESSLTRPVREYLEALDAAEQPRKPP